MARMPQTVGLLVVDDEQNAADDLATRLRDRLSKWSSEQDQGRILVHFDIRTFVSRDRENAEEFRDRFQAYLAADGADRDFSLRLKFIVFDYMYKLLGTRELSEVNGTVLARVAQRSRPDCFRYLYTQRELAEVQKSSGGVFHGQIHKGDIGDNVALTAFVVSIARALEDINETPLWNALRDFSATDKLVMHALATSDGELLARSPSLGECLNFYGLNYFRSESSSTIAPLDSLLHPTGSILRAQRRFAGAFGADGCLFVTSGTSTSNKVVYEALCSPGDLVLLDRNCHISHHFACRMVRAKVAYVEPISDEERDIGLSVDLSVFKKGFAALVSSLSKRGQVVLPRIISLTNCTFDGAIVDPRKIIECVVEVLQEKNIKDRLIEIAFLFDEAWFGFARFHPILCYYSAMAAVEDLRNDPFYKTNLRVYSTTSVHKTMYGFRQASVILLSDPLMRASILGSDNFTPEGRRLEHAFLSYTTTSPNLGILASLDVCRRHMWFEGGETIDRAIYSARKFIQLCNHEYDDIASVFHAGYASELGVKTGSIAALDPTKVTLRTWQNIPGNRLRQFLWEAGKIQVNKVGKDTCLLMFMPGFSENKLVDLMRRLGLVANQILRDSGSGDGLRRQLSAVTTLNMGGWSQVFDLAAGYEEAWSRESTLFPLNGESRGTLEAQKGKWFSSDFVTPYPPGYPFLVPGECVDAVSFEKVVARSSGEIHGAEKVPSGGLGVRLYRRKKAGK